MSRNYPLVFATNNENKVNEARMILGGGFPIISLHDIDIKEELPESHDTLKENALEKAQFIFDITGRNCFAEDTGLEIEALGMRPGVRTARYAGLEKSAMANMALVLSQLGDIINRKAFFHTVIAFIESGNPVYFEGYIAGTIAKELSGNGGFGYDPIFIPDGFNETFAQLPPLVKNGISHRARAFQAFKSYLS